MKKTEKVITLSLLEHIYKSYSTDGDRLEALIAVLTDIPEAYILKRRWELERLEAEKQRQEEDPVE